jgi:hypothetical protein
MIMDTFVSFSKNPLVSDFDIFFDEYDSVHPGSDVVVVTKLHPIFARILFECEIFTDGYKRHMNMGFDDSYYELRKLYWLFCDMNFVSLVYQLRSFIIEKNDLTLDSKDYALLFYVSLQNKEVQNATHNLTLNMLHEMFFPIAEEKFNKWKLVS